MPTMASNCPRQTAKDRSRLLDAIRAFAVVSLVNAAASGCTARRHSTAPEGAAAPVAKSQVMPDADQLITAFNGGDLDLLQGWMSFARDFLRLSCTSFVT